MKCFNCDKPIEEFGPDDCCVNGAIAFEGTPGYGSRFDSSLLCEESLQIAVCDDCMVRKFASVNLVNQPRPVPQLARVQPWSPDYDCNEPGASRLAEALKNDPTHPDHPDYKGPPWEASADRERLYGDLIALDPDALLEAAIDMRNQLRSRDTKENP